MLFSVCYTGKKSIHIKEAMKEQLINRLTLLDTSAYRCIGLAFTGKYSKEPQGYRARLAKIYSSLDVEQLKELIRIKE